MKPFKLKHIPTGLYYIPVREVVVKSNNNTRYSNIKSNLSKIGKIYTKNVKDIAAHMQGSFYNHTIVKVADGDKLYKDYNGPIYQHYPRSCSLVKVNVDDWELEYL